MCCSWPENMNPGWLSNENATPKLANHGCTGCVRKCYFETAPSFHRLSTRWREPHHKGWGHMMIPQPEKNKLQEYFERLVGPEVIDEVSMTLYRHEAEDALRESPANIDALNLLGAIEAHRGDDHAAHGYFRSAFEVGSSPLTALNFVLSCVNVGKLKEARELLEVVVSNWPSVFEGEKAVWAMHVAITVLAKNGFRSAADSLLQKAYVEASHG